jgi:hypothetical protein
LSAFVVAVGIIVWLFGRDHGLWLFSSGAGVFIFGFAVDRAKGGTGAVGGGLAGAALTGGAGLAIYAYFGWNARPDDFDYLGPPALTIPFLCIGGSICGVLISAGLCFAIDVIRYFSPRAARTNSMSNSMERPFGQSPHR